MRSFGELLTEYMKRSGISDSEMARAIGVQRQTIFRWKEGSVVRPRLREDVLRCSAKLRLTPEERDLLLISAGFPPEHPVPSASLQSFSDATGSETTASAPPFSSPPPALDMAPQLAGERQAEIARDVPSHVSPYMPGQDSLGALLEAADVRLAETDAASRATPFSNSSPVSFANEGTPATKPVWLAGSLWRWLGYALLAAIGVIVASGSPWGDREQSWLTWFTPATPTLAPMPTATPEPSPAPTPVPTLPFAQAGHNEQLIVIAEFGNYTGGNRNYRLSSRLRDALQSEIEAIDLRGVRVEIWPQVIDSRSQALQVLRHANATLFVWGEYDDLRVAINYNYSDARRTGLVERTLQSLDDLPTVIQEDAPRAVKMLALLTLGLVYRDANAPLAQTVLERALAQKSDEVELTMKTLFYLATIYTRQSCNLERAELAMCDRTIDLYRQLIALEPQPAAQWVNAWYNRGNAYYARSILAAKGSPELQEDLNAAIADYSRAIEIAPAYSKPFFNRGSVYYTRNQNGDTERAIADLSEALRLQPDQASVYFTRGLALMRQDGDGAWDADLRQALALNPDDSASHVALCWGYALAAEPEQALAECDAARTLVKDASQFADAYGIVYAQLGRTEEALAELQRYLEWLKTTQPTQLFERKNGPLVEGWIKALNQGRNPFDQTMLERLRKA
jgi:tetratricopeptide (TPR) repeat protein/transcriptional regulator with XRE-family HTH domain